MTKILKSLMILALVASSVYGVSQSGAWFTDEEVLGTNSFDTGSIDIAVDQRTSEPFVLSDLKPGQHGYHEFIINNVGTNPANIYKLLTFGDCVNIPVSEPEEVEETSGPVCNLQDVIDYDLKVWVYENDSNVVAWNQTIYAEELTVSGAYAEGEVLLGMVPAGWHMKVEQSYYMPTAVGNEYQQDSVSYEMTLRAEQLRGTVVLDDKEPNLPETGDWWVQHDDVMATLTYPVRDKTFAFTFSGKAPQANTNYSLVIGNDLYNGGKLLGSATSSGDGTVSISGDIDLNETYTNAKVWLVLSSHWTGSTMSGWTPSAYLFETGLMDYYDADIY